MKRKILGGIAILAIAAVAALNVNLGNQGNWLSDISLANVEALAGNEPGEGSGGQACYWKNLKCKDGVNTYEGCLSNGDGNACTCGSVSRNC